MSRVPDSAERELGSISNMSNTNGRSNEVTQALKTRVFTMKTEVSKLKNNVNRLGGRLDTTTFRDTITKSVAKLQDDAKNIKNDLERVTPEMKNRQTAKLISDFHAVLREFEATMKTAKSKEAATLPKDDKARPALDVEQGGGGFKSEQAHLLQEQTQQQRQQEDLVPVHELEYNEQVIVERDQGIQEISHQITELNELFKDMAVLVQEQGVQLDVIDTNIDNFDHSIRSAGTELNKAQNYQKAARNRMCWILLVVALIMVVLVIVLSST